MSVLNKQPTSSFCQRVALDEWFSYFGVCLIGLNTVALCCDYPRASDTLQAGLYWANFGFVACFLLEACIRIAGLGIAVYFSSWLEFVDIVIVVVSVFECGGSLVAASGAKSNVGALRLFRLLRITRLAKLFRLRSLKQVFDTIAASLSSLIALCILITMFGFIFAVLGMQLFGGKYKKVSRSNFDSFKWAVMTVFQIISGENYDVSLPSEPNPTCVSTAKLSCGL
jgi:voltage-dependent calcium channel L type alpha-1D